ncbi:hypothetical protein ABZ863_29180 [Saccharomonospora sp. NPDC046836]|uniref:hypothetical protein n=1 Tax=Saccharomonospora sp. NPDC046836 TaxID=3156921 RepID=UPI0033FE7B54
MPANTSDGTPRRPATPVKGSTEDRTQVTPVKGSTEDRTQVTPVKGSTEDRTQVTPLRGPARWLPYLASAIAALAVGAVVILGLNGRTEAAVAAGTIGAAIAAGGVNVTVTIRS